MENITLEKTVHIISGHKPENEHEDTDVISSVTEKKRRGRKKKVVAEAEGASVGTGEHTNAFIDVNSYSTQQQKDHVHKDESTTKKRGRKPKGGKLISKNVETADAKPPLANIILHLKCSIQDLNEHNNKLNQIVTDPLKYNPEVPPNIMTYNSSTEDTMFTNYTNEETLTGNNNKIEQSVPAYKEFSDEIKSEKNNYYVTNGICQACKTSMENKESCIEDETDGIQIKDINAKLKKVKLQLYKNSNPDKKAACFWCTYDFDNQTCYIPKYEMDGQLYGYGSFCRPECAVAYLMKENIDDSTKFERYHLLNQIYSKIYQHKKNIKPAPNPYFLLDKFYGNLSIQEYRKLLKTEHMLLVIEKPMTRILPELHEDNEDFIMNIYGGKGGAVANQTGFYKVKRQSEKQKGPSKTSIMKENFGMA